MQTQHTNTHKYTTHTQDRQERMHNPTRSATNTHTHTTHTTHTMHTTHIEHTQRTDAHSAHDAHNTTHTTHTTRHTTHSTQHTTDNCFPVSQVLEAHGRCFLLGPPAAVVGGAVGYAPRWAARSAVAVECNLVDVELFGRVRSTSVASAWQRHLQKHATHNNSAHTHTQRAHHTQHTHTHEPDLTHMRPTTQHPQHTHSTTHNTAAGRKITQRFLPVAGASDIHAPPGHGRVGVPRRIICTWQRVAHAPLPLACGPFAIFGVSVPIVEFPVLQSRQPRVTQVFARSPPAHRAKTGTHTHNAHTQHNTLVAHCTQYTHARTAH